MKTFVALVVWLSMAAVPSFAQVPDRDESLRSVLREELIVALLTNEEIVAGDRNDLFTSQVVDKINNGKEVSEDDLDIARRFCESTLVFIGTPKLRKKMVANMMKSVDDKIEQWAWSGGSDERYFRARRMQAALRRRFSSLLEFRAERSRRFLEVLKTRL